MLGGKPLPDESAVAAILQREQAFGKEGCAALHKVGRIQVGGRTLEGVEERPGSGANTAGQHSSPNRLLMSAFSV